MTIQFNLRLYLQFYRKLNFCLFLYATTYNNKLWITVDCSWEPWKNWSPCSASCKGGIQARTRSHNPARHNGKSCNGTSTESRVCNNETCKYLIENMVWGIIVMDSDNWKLDKMSKCCCDNSPDFEVI